VQTGKAFIQSNENPMTDIGNASQPPTTAGDPAYTAGLREDLLHHDPLLDCLVQLTRLHGRPSTRAALSAGLPLGDGV